MSTGMRAPLGEGMGSGLLVRAPPVVFMFGGSANGLPVIDPMSIGALGLLKPCMGKE